MHLIKKNLVSLIDSQGKVLKDIDLGSLIGSELAKNSAKKSANKNSSVATDYVVTTTDGVLASAEDQDMKNDFSNSNKKKTINKFQLQLLSEGQLDKIESKMTSVSSKKGHASPLAKGGAAGSSL